MRENILIIEDDEDISQILMFSLTKEGYTVKINNNGLRVEDDIQTFKPDLILLDIMLGDRDGFSICKEISKYKIPIIMLTARVDIIDKILGLELGADDYITKPFDIREVITRIRVALRRKKEIVNEGNTKESISNGKISISEGSRIVEFNGEEIKLKPKEFDLLLFLTKNKNRVYSRNDLLNLVLGYDFIGYTRTIDVHITRLRQKLKKEVNIETVFGVGYMLKESNVNNKT
ncbi:response regulator transcription factor [Clostridium gasigenes]|uniref:Stage 0 sporulation protein A homolog n=1 Tax=Clostridium gasigenes TaxID=94869 RepID=A0A1H0QDR4_9CLOT|nr:response regulator transcription factor [Clostridium gasigenes]MBB6623370.1 response regulator transcription factor [Clostridium gasigenes]MBU3088006.1 response regulator transcription factor [Clostridium gasigenes]SDP14849.1 DNA-binding response regulator, OmpR family, contains REC and winged-helix (wHTH) domain [Clostridium gasigenes]